MALTHDSVQYSATSVPNRGSVGGVINGNVTSDGVAGVRAASAASSVNISGAASAVSTVSNANISGAASNAGKGAQR